MTDTTSATLADPIDGGHDGGHDATAHHGLSDRGYIRVAVTLAVITAVEVAWSYLPWWDGATGGRAVLATGGLLAMMAFKFAMVASNFMHLKFDDKILTRVFYAGLFLAVGVYLAALTTFQIWGSNTPGYH